MSEDVQKKFISKAKKEIAQRVKQETKALLELNNEKEELTDAIMGYGNYYHNLEHFIIESMQDFTVNEEDLPKYFKSNINVTYREYVNIRQDALNEISALNKYIDHCKHEVKNNERKLKFYSSQYNDSDFFKECLPLVELYKEKIQAYNENITLTQKTITELEKIAKKLENWK